MKQQSTNYSLYWKRRRPLHENWLLRLPITRLICLQYLRNIGKPFLESKYRKNVANIEFFSSVTGKRACTADHGPDYWVSNMLSEVKFDESLRPTLHSNWVRLH